MPFYRNRKYYADWQAVLIYGSRSLEQDDAHPDRALLNSDQVHRVYLDELGAIATLPLGIAAMVLTIVNESEAPEQARLLLERTQQETRSTPARQGIIDMISRIMVYKFTNLSKQDIDAMLDIKLEETRVYQDAREEERRAIACNMLRDNLPLEQISRLTGLSVEQLQQLQSQLSQESETGD